jgi:hypothetical protein
MSKRIYGFVFALAAMFAVNSAFAQANLVYIDQIGNNSVIDVTQTGGSNSVGNTAAVTKLYGNNQTVTVSQIGSTNVAAINLQGNNPSLATAVTGSFNTVTVECGGGIGTLAACTDSALILNATGDHNEMTIQSGAKNTSTTNITGDTNTLLITTKTNNLLGATSLVSAVGNLNDVTILQDGPAGGNGFYAKLDITGASNTIGVYQSGSADSKVDLKTAGSNNTITVHSGN